MKKIKIAIVFLIFISSFAIIETNYNASEINKETNDTYIYNENRDKYATGTGNTFVYDKDNIYYSINKNLYKANYDGTNETILSENGTYENLVLHNDKIYFLDSDYIINKIDTNGNSLKSLNIKQLSDYKIYSFIIYKDRIYFIDNNSMSPDDSKFFKFVSTDLNGGNLTETLIPKAQMYNGERYKRYYMSFIYNDYVFFSSSELGPEADVFRVKLDGSDLENTNMLGYPLGCFADNSYYTSVNSTNIWKDSIGLDDNSEDTNPLYKGIDAYKNEDVAYWNAVMDSNYIVVSYAWKAEKFHNIVVMDLDGNVVNVKHIPKRYDDIYTNDEIVVSIINDYVYYKYYNSYHNGESIGRFELQDNNLVSQNIQKTNNMPFFKNDVNSFNYKIEHTFNDDLNTVSNTKLTVKKTKEIAVGNIYNIYIKDVNYVPKPRLNLGYFLVADNFIIRLSNKEIINSIKEPITLKNAKKYGEIVYLDPLLDYEQNSNNKDIHNYVDVDKNVVEYKSYNDSIESGYYESFKWDKNFGLIEYRSGFGAQRDAISLSYIK